MGSNAYKYGGNAVGYGHFDLPPLLIGTLFYQGETIVDRTDPSIFNEEKAKKRINLQLELSKKYKIPNLIEISAISEKEMMKYLDFFLDNYQPPFVLGGTLDARIAGMEHLKERGVHSDQYLYNTISNLKNKHEMDALKKFKIDSVVVLILGASNMTSTQRYAYLTEKNQPGSVSIIDGLKAIGIEKIWIDGGVIDLESLAHILETQRLISESLQLPVGTASNLFLFKFSSPRLNIKFHTRYRRASIMFMTSWYSNFIFYGAIEDAKECFASAAQAFEFKQLVKERNIRLFD